MKVLPLPKAVIGGVKPKGSEALPFGPKNHSEGKMLGRGFVGVIVAEHTREAFPPACSIRTRGRNGHSCINVYCMKNRSTNLNSIKLLITQLT